MNGRPLLSRLVQPRPLPATRRIAANAATQDRILYWGSGSYPCWRVMIALDEKKLPYNGELLEFSKRGHKSPEIMALNPRGQLPTFKDGDCIVNESAAIVMYLENQYPEISLTPSIPVEKSNVFQRFFEALVTDQRLLSYTYPKRKGLENPLEDQNLEIVKNELALWDGYLSKTEYAATDSFSIADVIFAPMMLIVQRFGLTCRDYPNLKRYLTMIQDRPSVVKNSPPHWKGAEPAYSFMNIL